MNRNEKKTGKKIINILRKYGLDIYYTKGMVIIPLDKITDEINNSLNIVISKLTKITNIYWYKEEFEEYFIVKEFDD